MATAKQLAALKKAREARAKNAKKKAPVKPKTAVRRKTTKKPVARKSASANTSSHYVIYKMHNRKKFYFTGAKLDDEITKARTYANKHLADAAIEMAKSFGVKLIALKK